MLTHTTCARYVNWMSAHDPANPEAQQMLALIAKLATGNFSQNFTENEIRLMAKMRGQKEVILSILYAEIEKVVPINEQGSEKINNLLRMVEKICD